MDSKTLERMYPELYTMFGGYFNQDYRTITEGFDDSKPVIPQLTNVYKNDCNKEQLAATIKELEDLINMHYTEDVIRTITYEFSMWININYYGYTYKQFLREILQILKDEQYRPID